MSVRSRMLNAPRHSARAPQAPVSAPRPMIALSRIGDAISSFGDHEWSHIACGVLGVLLSGVIWLFGAKFSADGLLIAFNFVLWFFGIGWSFVAPPVAFVYVIVCPIPIAISLVEFRNSPLFFDQDLGQWALRPIGVWVVWSFFLALDYGTNYVGLVAHDDSPLWWQQAVSNQTMRVALSAAMTAGPELLLRSMIAYIRAAW